ncbi:MAG: polyprenyl synthetase family protein [Oscillospiraceae bacterium]|nr:polyprenyl synthetase family protein [Oscillospiraceae bacterium]
MWYSLMAGGKRIRPVLTLEFCRVCGGDVNSALSAACALEMIHTFSLIHDDLPCMDDDDMRRGKPSCHKVYGEAMALLAGDALLNYAYEVIADDKNVSSEIKIKLISELSKSVGVAGMIGGQVIDTTYSGGFNDESLLDMYSMKTGALLKIGCKMGCVAAQADAHKIKCAESYAEKLGLAFQIIDDILDISGDEKLLGKPIGSDAECGKVTYASLNGIEKSRAFARKLTDEALEILDEFENNELLKELTRYLLNRDY